MDGVLGIVKRIAGPLRTPAEAGPTTPLGDGGFCLDSISLLEVVLGCEEGFGVVFDPETDLTAERLLTVRTLAAVVCSRTRQ